MIKTLSLGLGLLKVCLFVKLESSDCKIYWTKSARFDRSKIRLDRSNHVQIYFFAEIPIQSKPSLTCRVLYFTPSIKGKTLATFLEVFGELCVESFVRSERFVSSNTHIELSRSRFISRT